MSDTPRMDAALKAEQATYGEAKLLTEGIKLERELNAANAENQRLTTANLRLSGEWRRRIFNKLQLHCYRQSYEINELHEKLCAANDYIKRLEEALGCVVISCDYLHHEKKHQHKLGEPCPVEQLVRKAKEAKP